MLIRIRNLKKSQDGQAIILAGGPAVKMRPLTYEIPKALIPVGGRPLSGALASSNQA